MRRNGLGYKKSRSAWLLKRPMYVAMARVKKRAKETGLPFNITDADLPVPEFCPVLGIRLEFNHGKGKTGPTDSSPSVDRIRGHLGYTKGNVRVISNRANRLKSDATAEELRLIANDLEANS